MAEDDDVGVGVELLMGAGGDVSHGHEEGVGEVGDFELPRLADVEEERGVGLFTEGEKDFRSDLGWEHGFRIAAGADGCRRCGAGNCVATDHG